VRFLILALALATAANAVSERNVRQQRPSSLPHSPSTRSDSGSTRDLDGVWSYATLTPFERPAEFANVEFFTDAQAAAKKIAAARPGWWVHAGELS